MLLTTLRSSAIRVSHQVSRTLWPQTKRLVGDSSTLRSRPSRPQQAGHSSAGLPPSARKLGTLGLTLLGVGSGAFFLLNAFEDSMMFYMTPTQVLERDPPMPSLKKFRLGGLVVEGSVKHSPTSLAISFQVTDLENEMLVHFEGMLPDLFREGQSVVTEGFLDEDGNFFATEVLAKHDESYMPASIAKMVEENKAAAVQESTDDPPP